jgi:hypothetical protein
MTAVVHWIASLGERENRVRLVCRVRPPKTLPAADRPSQTTLRPLQLPTQDNRTVICSTAVLLYSSTVSLSMLGRIFGWACCSVAYSRVNLRSRLYSLKILSFCLVTVFEIQSKVSKQRRLQTGEDIWQLVYCLPLWLVMPSSVKPEQTKDIFQSFVSTTERTKGQALA